MNARELVTGPVRNTVQAHKSLQQEVSAELRALIQPKPPSAIDYTLEINGCFKWKVVIEFHYTPEEPRAYDYPGYPAEAEIVRILANGEDIKERLPKEFVEALTEDLRQGGL